VEVEQDAGTVELMQEDYSKRGVELNASRLRMAQLPTPSEVFLEPPPLLPTPSQHPRPRQNRKMVFFITFEPEFWLGRSRGEGRLVGPTVVELSPGLGVKYSLAEIR
jgi:hypothetical protein